MKLNVAVIQDQVFSHKRLELASVDDLELAVTAQTAQQLRNGLLILKPIVLPAGHLLLRLGQLLAESLELFTFARLQVVEAEHFLA